MSTQASIHTHPLGSVRRALQQRPVGRQLSADHVLGTALVGQADELRVGVPCHCRQLVPVPLPVHRGRLAHREAKHLRIASYHRAGERISLTLLQCADCFALRCPVMPTPLCEALVHLLCKAQEQNSHSQAVQVEERNPLHRQPRAAPVLQATESPFPYRSTRTREAESKMLQEIRERPALQPASNRLPANLPLPLHEAHMPDTLLLAATLPPPFSLIRVPRQAQQAPPE